VKSGKYRLLRLTQRVDDQHMPVIRVVDMKRRPREAANPSFRPRW